MPTKETWTLQDRQGSRYLPPLDGIRAFAVAAVMAYHGGVAWAGGGFLGVDVFFVLSGFLITTLLVGEHQARGAISLLAFWARRARRLLPALMLMLVVAAALIALLRTTDTFGPFRLDALSTLFYAKNWHDLLANQNYFAQAALPSPLRHTWSLAIEEQFYLVWPLVAVVVLRWRRSALGVVALAGAIGSALAMALLYHPGGDPSRVYYGTDTRAQSLLIGAALAVALVSARPAQRLASQLTLSATGWAGAAFVAWACVNLAEPNKWLFRGGFTAVALAVSAVILAVVQVPGGTLARLLSLPPVRYVGRISYGLYLWHWPVYVFFDSAHTGLRGWQLLWARIAVTFAVAVLSFHLVEQPIRTGRVRIWLRTWRGGIATAAGMGATAATVLVATAAATPALANASLPASSAPSSAASSLGTGRSAAPAPAAPPPIAAPSQASLALSPLDVPVRGPVPPDRPVKLLIEGDSMATTLSFGMGPVASRYGVDLQDRGIIGCGLIGGGTVTTKGVVHPIASGLSGGGWIPCAAWPTRWQEDVNRVDPDVAAVFVGPYEVRDHTINGQPSHIGEPLFDETELSLLAQAAQILGAKGAHVMFFTSPYYNQGEAPDGSQWPEDHPQRVDRLNQLMAQVAEANPGRVSLAGVGQLMSPQFAFTPVIDGVQVRDGDGLHVTPQGARWLAERILPEVVGLARGQAPPLPLLPPYSCP